MANYYFDNGQGGQQTHSQVVEWLNEAATTADGKAKVSFLKKAKEVILNSTHNLLDNFVEDLLNFQSDSNANVRLCVVEFIEDACKKDPSVIPRVVGNLQIMLCDTTAQVQKRVIIAATSLYKCALVWMSTAKHVTEEMETAWNMLGEIKQQIIFMVDNDNDGIRTVSVKFLETVISLQTYPDGDTPKNNSDFSLEDVPFALKFARRRKLEEEAKTFFELLIKFHGSPHVSMSNLMTCMASLVQIAKKRPQFMSRVVSALETLNINLPPTLFKTQVSSVRKHLRIYLQSLLKQPAAHPLHGNITALLTDLGATASEINRAMPKPEELRRFLAKRAAEAVETAPAKKMRTDAPEATLSDEEMEYEPPRIVPQPQAETTKDITEMFIFERLTPEMTASLVFQFMPKLPETMPSHFVSTFTPIAAAGTPNQIRHLARLLASQMTAASAAPATKKLITDTFIPRAPAPPSLQPVSKKEPAPSLSRIPRTYTLKLAEITRRLSDVARGNLLKDAIVRILSSEKAAVAGGVMMTRNKVITSMASTFHPGLRQITVDHITEDIKRRIDLALSWLYDEHSFMQGFNRHPIFFKQDARPDSYNELLCNFICHVIDRAKLDPKDREMLLGRLYLEAPLITEPAMDLLKTICCDESRSTMGLKLLEELIVKRPPRQMHLLNVLLIQTSHENNMIRTEALDRVVTLYKRTELSTIIEEYSVFYLGFLKIAIPPDVLFGADRGRPVKVDVWTEETIRACLYLFMTVLPLKEKLIHELAQVYIATSPDIKRVILRHLEQPVRGMGMHSPELLALLEECPKSAETLVTRIVHVLTDKATPSAELVSRVRDLYNTRVSDVRFLIPVLNGLRKEEVIAALPKLLKLTPAVVKEVFARLLSSNPDGSCASPLTPADLLVALHVIDPAKCDLKLVIKATSLCFGERHVYTQETLALVLQTLMEINPMPTLLMRTVIQALQLYPRLSGFIMNILQRLISKQVWKQKRVWEGFIKCCQRTTPQSFQVLLQLPPAQLIDVFMECPELQKPLLDHVMSFTEHQRKHISRTTMEVLRGNKLVILDEPGEYPPLVAPTNPAQLPVIEVKKEKEPEAEPETSTAEQ